MKSVPVVFCTGGTLYSSDQKEVSEGFGRTLRDKLSDAPLSLCPPPPQDLRKDCPRTSPVHPVPLRVPGEHWNPFGGRRDWNWSQE